LRGIVVHEFNRPETVRSTRACVTMKLALVKHGGV
jgi:hypothetical protein